MTWPDSRNTYLRIEAGLDSRWPGFLLLQTQVEDQFVRLVLSLFGRPGLQNRHDVPQSAQIGLQELDIVFQFLIQATATTTLSSWTF